MLCFHTWLILDPCGRVGFLKTSAEFEEDGSRIKKQRVKSKTGERWPSQDLGAQLHNITNLIHLYLRPPMKSHMSTSPQTKAHLLASA